MNATTALNKSNSSMDNRSDARPERSLDDKNVGRTPKTMLPKVNGKSQGKNTVTAKKEQTKTVRISEGPEASAPRKKEGKSNDSLIVEQSLPETTKGMKFKNTQGRHKKSICSV